MGTQRVSTLRDVKHGPSGSRLRLLAPLRYLAIQHAEKKYDLVAPAVLAGLACAAYWWIEPRPRLVGDAGLFATLRDILIMAVPFLIGALATVAMGTPGQHFDRRPVGAPIMLDGTNLTLRQFVCYLLGYLSFLGMTTLGFVVAAQVFYEPFCAWAGDNPSFASAIIPVVTLAVALLVSALVVTVFWALYFLTEVVSRSD